MAKLACAAHILLKTEQHAKDLIKQLDQGSSFDRLAIKHSICPSAKKGGNLGEFRRGSMVAQFDKAVFANGSEDKKYVGPIKTKFGFHLIQVLYKT